MKNKHIWLFYISFLVIHFSSKAHNKNKLVYNFLNKYNFSKKNVKNGTTIFKQDIKRIDFTKNKKLIKYC